MTKNAIFTSRDHFRRIFLPQEDIKCNNIKFIFEFFKKTFFFGKNDKKNFRGKHPKYNEFITIGELPKKTFYRFQLSIWEKKSTEKPYIWILIKKIFHRNSLKCLICNPHRFLGVAPVSVTRLWTARGEWQPQPPWATSFSYWLIYSK